MRIALRPARSLTALLLPVLLALAAVPVPAAAAIPVAGAQQAQATPEADTAEEAPRFFADLDDLPLMAGLQEMAEASIAFDKPGGRIGEVYAEGAVPAEQVRAFYEEALPHFGWQAVAENRYRRDGESLELEISEAAGVTTLRIALSPTD
ncbi:MAG: hypothetical protein WD100_06120 [Tistlia sp.]